VVLKSRERYYIVSIYKYYQLTLFLVLFGSLTKSQIFSVDWSKLGLGRDDRARWGENVIYKNHEKLVENRIYKGREWYYIVSMYNYY